MCDTVVVTAEAAADDVATFGKNSDRDPNGAYRLLYVRATDHRPGSSVQCTHITIPQAAHTFSWIWVSRQAGMLAG
jgi:secernin